MAPHWAPNGLFQHMHVYPTAAFSTTCLSSGKGYDVNASALAQGHPHRAMLGGCGPGRDHRLLTHPEHPSVAMHLGQA